MVSIDEMDNSKPKPKQNKKPKKIKKAPKVPVEQSLAIIPPVTPIPSKEAINTLKGIMPGFKGKRPQIKIVQMENLDPEMQEVMMSAIREIAIDQNKEGAILNRDLGVLESVVSEYLKTFMVIGYTMDGSKISIFHANNPQESDSIIEHARGTLMNLLIKSQQGLNGGAPPGSGPAPGDPGF